MRKHLLLLLVALTGGGAYASPPGPGPVPGPGPGPLDQALALVLAVAPSLNTERANVQRARKQSDFNVNLKLSAGYAEKSSQEFAPGVDVRGIITMEIPLFGEPGAREERAEARAKLWDKEDKLKANFLKDVQRLIELRAAAILSERKHALQKDKLEYFKQKHRAGEVESDRLWDYAEAANSAGNDSAEKWIEYSTEINRVSREYGGERWLELVALIARHTENITDNLRL